MQLNLSYVMLLFHTNSGGTVSEYGTVCIRKNIPGVRVSQYIGGVYEIPAKLSSTTN